VRDLKQHLESKYLGLRVVECTYASPKSLHKILQRPAQAVKLPDQEHVELSFSGVVHHFGESWTVGVRAGETLIDIFAVDPPSGFRRKLPQLVQLHFHFLLVGGNPGINANALGWVFAHTMTLGKLEGAEKLSQKRLQYINNRGKNK